MSENKRILIATPSYDGKVVVWYARELCTLVTKSAAYGIKFDPIFVCYDSLIQRCRNILMTYALENAYDGILWIDSDMIWESQWAIDLVNSGKDVIGVPCVIKSNDEEKYNVYCKLQDLVIKGGYIEVESIGTGFLYMSIAALKYLYDKADVQTGTNSKGEPIKWMMSSTLLRNGGFVGEDIDLCYRLREGGFSIFIDPYKTCGHVGVTTYTGNFSKFLTQASSFSVPKAKV